MTASLFALSIGFLLDLVFGDPDYSWHPVRIIGRFISTSETFLRKIFSEDAGAETAAGILLVFIIVIPSFFVPVLILFLAEQVHPFLRIIVESIMCYQLLALKSLKTESTKVYRSLYVSEEAAKKDLSMIVGRDTKPLDRNGIIKATVETVAENTSDGIIAPLFYMAIGGAPLGFLYKAVNTMDSMVGYKNNTYLYFGRAGAKTDDLLNYIPSRLSALFMILSSFLSGYDGRHAFFIWRRDRLKHASPNSAQTEAACAGALHLELAGDAWYFGRLYKKETIGDPVKEPEPEDIVRADKLLYASSFLAFFIFFLLKLGINYLTL